MMRHNPTASRSRFITALILVLLTGCASHSWAPPPGKSSADFEAQKAQCSLFARNGGTGFAAAGSTRFVAGAAVGHAIGDGIKAQADFNDCMAANGWTVADQSPEKVAAQKQRNDLVKTISANRTACFNALRADPIVAPIVRHLPDTETGKFTITQLADTGYPSPEESVLVARYSDASSQCRDRAITALTGAVPPVALQHMREGGSNVDSRTVLLIQQRLTWGEWAMQVAQINEDVATKIRSGR